MSRFDHGSCKLPLYFMLSCFTCLAASFNIDTVHPIIYKDPTTGANSRESYFGYSVQFLFSQKDNAYNSAKWLLVGAPRANSTFPTLTTITEPGQVYRCLLGNSEKNNCQPLTVEREASQHNRDKLYRDRKDYGWLGGSMAVNNPLTGRVAVCGYRWSNKIRSTEHFMNGVCYWNSHQIMENEDFVKVLPIVSQDQQVINGTYNYGYGQSGFSVHMALKNEGTEEMIIGAPGVYKWTGAVIRVSDYIPNTSSGVPSRRKRQEAQDVIEFGQTIVPDVAKISRLEPNDYFGYSVHSGIFFNDGKLLYVSGAPRAAEMRGKVLIFDFLPGKDSQLDIRLELNGTQLGEYFGASVLAIDLTRDGKAELLVGAPQHSLRPETSDRSGDEGKVYVYLNQNGKLERGEALYGNKARGAQFGTAMSSAGDLNGDGFNDVAIGAPYEDEKGAVYLYLGGMHDLRRHPTKGYWQRIAAADFSGVPPLNSLRGFGISLVSADMDGNSSPDLAVGSFLSGHALVFRSRPVIQLKMMNRNENKIIDPEINGDSVEWKVCPSFESKYSIPEICVAYTFYFDANYNNNPRLILEIDGKTYNQQPFNYTSILRSGRPSCHSPFKLTLAKTPHYSQDFSQPAVLRLTAKLMKNVRPINDKCPTLTNESMMEDLPGSQYILVPGDLGVRKNVNEFCATCPVMDKTENNYVESAVVFTSDCGTDIICEEDLEVSANFITDVRELVVGSKKTLSFEVSVKNHAEPSYLTKLELHLPSYTNLKRTPTDLCEKPNFATTDELMYSCRLRVNPLKRSKAEKMEFELDLTSVPSGGSEALTIVVEARTKGVAAMGRRPRLNLTIPLKTAIDVEIVGNSVDEQRNYNRPNDTDIFVAKENIVFHHLYEVRNALPSPANEIDIEILLPFRVMNAQGISKQFLTPENTSVEAIQKKGQSNIKCSLNYNLGQLINNEDFLQSISAPSNIQRQPEFKFAKENRTAFIDCFNTKDIVCVKYVCSVAPLTFEKPIVVTLTGNLNLNNILSFIGKKDVFILSSAARVIIRQPANIQQPIGHKPDIAIATTHFLPQGPPVALAVASWIIALAVLAGIILLSLMVVGLHKMGFFKRQRPPQDGLMAGENPTPGDGSSEDPEVELRSNSS